MSEFATSDRIVEQTDTHFVSLRDLPLHGIGGHVIQNGKGQDFVFFAKDLLNENGELFNVLMEYDGHGGHQVINLIRQMPLGEIARLKNPFMEIRNRIRANNPSGQGHFRSGATFTMARIYKNHVVINYCGDSPAMVYINGSLVFQTIIHSVSDNDAERERVTKMGLRIVKGEQVSVVSKDILTKISSNLVDSNGDQCAASMSLGHNEAFGYDYVLDSDGNVQDGVLPDYVIPFEESDNVTVLVFSDGVGDIFNEKSREDHACLITDSVQQICEKYVERWNQSWVFIPDYDETLTYDITGRKRQIIGNPDDVSIAKCNIYPGRELL